MTTYRQCSLSKPGGRKSRRLTTSYIPEEFAYLGATVKLKQPDGSWDDGWEVYHVGEHALSAPDARKLIRHHRKATGDSMPKIIEEEP